MSKEAEKYLKENHPDPDSLFTGEPKRDEFLLKNITYLMQSYAKEEVDKALKEKEALSFYCYDELVNNAAEDYDSPKCTNQCIKCKE